jgi:arginine decarboxylase
VIWALWDSYQNVTSRSAVEAYHDAVHYFTDAHAQYVHGLLTLKDWSLLEQIYFATINKVKDKLDLSSRSHREIHDELNEKLADKLFVNFSLFQSMPDAWGIDQLFPVMPLERMNESLEHRAIIQDITCDSDGALKSYADGNGIESSLPLPIYKEDEQYLLGMFMVGAYQEILGDLHNLFGDTDSVHVELNSDGSYKLTNAIKGDTVADVLRYVQFDAEKLLQSYQNQLATSKFSAEQQASMLDELKAGVYGYTYFED